MHCFMMPDGLSCSVLIRPCSPTVPSRPLSGAGLASPLRRRREITRIEIRRPQQGKNAGITKTPYR